MRIPSRKLSQRIINASFAFVLALSTVTASMPFVFSQAVSAVSEPFNVETLCQNEKAGLKLTTRQNMLPGVPSNAENWDALAWYTTPHGSTPLFGAHTITENDIDTYTVYTDNTAISAGDVLVRVVGKYSTPKPIKVFGLVVGYINEWHAYDKTLQASYNDTNCDQTAPEASVTYVADTPTNASVVATITANEPIQNVDGWDRVDDKVIEKTYATNTNEVVTIADLAGNTSDVNIHIDWIDKEKPTILINPTAPGFVSGTTNINVGITDNQPLDSNMNKTIWVEFYGRYDQTKKAGQKVNLSSGSGVFAINTKNLPDGEYIMRVGSVSDAVGNTSGDKTFKYFTIDNTSPAISVHGSSPDEGDTLSGVRYTREGQADQQRNRFIFKVTDTSGVKKVAMYVFKDGVKVKEYALTQHGTHQEQWYADVDTTQFENGKYYISARAVDNVNNVKYFNNRLDSYHVYFDNTAPTITVKDGYVGDKDNRIFSNVSFALYDAYKVDKYIINGHESDFTDDKWSDANFNNIKSKLVQGLNTFTLYDAAGNSATYEFTYDSAQPDAPALSAEGLNSGDHTNQLSITAIWNKPSDDTVKYEYQYWNDIDGNQWKELNPWATTVFGESRTGDFTEGEGVHYLRVRAIDAAGNKSDWSNTFTVIYDQTKPDVSLVDYATNGNVITPNITATDLNGPLTYSWTGSNPSVTLSATNVLMPDFTVAADGSYSFDLTVTDAAGNSTTKTFSFVYAAPVDTDDSFTDVVLNGNPSTSDEEDVLGTQTENNNAAADTSTPEVKGASDSNVWKLAGLAWYWWLLVLAILAFIGGLIAALRRRHQEND